MEKVKKSLEKLVQLDKKFENNCNEDNKYNIDINYFRILHNYLIIERMFYQDILMNKKEINKYLKLQKLHSCEEIHNKFLELYDQEHIIRNNVETLDNIEPIRLFIKKNSNKIFNTLMKK